MYRKTAKSAVCQKDFRTNPYFSYTLLVSGIAPRRLLFRCRLNGAAEFLAAGVAEGVRFEVVIRQCARGTHHAAALVSAVWQPEGVAQFVGEAGEQPLAVELPVGRADAGG